MENRDANNTDPPERTRQSLRLSGDGREAGLGCLLTPLSLSLCAISSSAER